MGNSFGQALCNVLPGAHEGTPWLLNGRGPTLRRLFGAYENGDIWAAYRRLRHVDDDRSGFVDYDELKQIILMAEFHLIFIWDLYSQQNQLLDTRELLTMICVFSSAKLADKAKFLMTLFDASSSGSLTGAEIAQICVTVLRVLSKCTGIMERSRTVTNGLRNELPGLVPVYQQAIEQRNADATFSSDRCIGRAEVEALLTTFEAIYLDLPIGEPPPPGAVPPPPPDWGAAQQPSQRLNLDKSTSKDLSATGGGASAMRTIGQSRTRPRLTEAELAHFALVGGLDHVDDGLPAGGSGQRQLGSAGVAGKGRQVSSTPDLLPNLNSNRAAGAPALAASRDLGGRKGAAAGPDRHGGERLGRKDSLPSLRSKPGIH